MKPRVTLPILLAIAMIVILWPKIYFIYDHLVTIWEINNGMGSFW